MPISPSGARFHLPSTEARDGLIGIGALESGLYVVADGALAAIPLVPSDRSHIRELSSPTEYQIAAGTKFALADAVERNKLVHADQLEWRTSIVPDGALAGLPVSPPDGAWLRELDSDTEWQIAGGTKIRLTDAGRRQALSAVGVLRNELAVVPNGALAGLPEGPAEGALLKEPGSNTLFIWQCGSLYRIADAAQLDRLVASGKARLPILTVAGPLTDPPGGAAAVRRRAGHGLSEARLGGGQPVRADRVPAGLGRAPERTPRFAPTGSAGSALARSPSPGGGPSSILLRRTPQDERQARVKGSGGIF